MIRLAYLLTVLVSVVFAALSLASVAHAQIEHQLTRRVVVFPVRAEKAFDAAADEAWWQARDTLTESRRFLVASKQFLVKSDVFQPRGELEPADAIILGKLLDSHALITLQLFTDPDNRSLSMNVYDGGTGLPLWKKNVKLHPSLTVQDQLPSLAKRLALDFSASVPYQGFTVTDSLIGHTVYEEGDVKLAQVDLGVTTGAQIGDLVQWIRIVTTNTAPVFQGGARVTVFAEGKIVRLDQGIATVEISRATSLKDIKDYTLVRVPRESDRLISQHTIEEAARTTLTAELVSPEAAPMDQVARERRPLATTLSFVSSLAAFLLLAF